MKNEKIRVLLDNTRLFHHIVEIEIWDTYDFDLKEWNGFGNIVNNIAALLHCFDVGNDYDWRVSLTYDFKKK